MTQQIRTREFFEKRIADNLEIIETCQRILKRNQDSYVFCTHYIDECNKAIKWCVAQLNKMEDQ